MRQRCRQEPGTVIGADCDSNAESGNRRAFENDHDISMRCNASNAESRRRIELWSATNSRNFSLHTPHSMLGQSSIARGLQLHAYHEITSRLGEQSRPNRPLIV